MDEKIIEFIKGLMQPLITIIAVVILFVLVTNNYDPDKMFALAGGILLFWFGYTGLKNFTFTGSTKPTIVEMKPKDETPKADEQTVAQDEPAPEPEPEPGVDFDAVSFEKAVEASVIPQYTVKNDSTVFYTARTKFINTEWTAEGFKNAAQYVLDLAKQNFRTIWGLPEGVDPIPYATEHLNDNLGCTTCAAGGCTYPDLRFKAMQMGTGYYAAYLDLIEMTKYVA